LIPIGVPKIKKMNRIKTTIFLLVMPLIAFSQFSQSEIELKMETFSEQELVTECTILLSDGYFYAAGLISDKLLITITEEVMFI